MLPNSSSGNRADPWAAARLNCEIECICGGPSGLIADDVCNVRFLSKPLSELPLKRLCLFRKLLRIVFFELTEVLELPTNSWQQCEMWKAQEVPFGSVLYE